MQKTYSSLPHYSIGLKSPKHNTRHFSTRQSQNQKKKKKKERSAYSAQITKRPVCRMQTVNTLIRVHGCADWTLQYFMDAQSVQDPRCHRTIFLWHDPHTNMNCMSYMISKVPDQTVQMRTGIFQVSCVTSNDSASKNSECVQAHLDCRCPHTHVCDRNLLHDTDHK